MEFERQYYSVLENQYVTICVIIRGVVTQEFTLNIHYVSKGKLFQTSIVKYSSITRHFIIGCSKVVNNLFPLKPWSPFSLYCCLHPSILHNFVDPFLRFYEERIIEVSVEVFRLTCFTAHIRDDFYFNLLEREVQLELQAPFDPEIGFGDLYPAWLIAVDRSGTIIIIHVYTYTYIPIILRRLYYFYFLERKSAFSN